MPRKSPLVNKAKTIVPAPVHTSALWVAGFGLTLAVAGASAFHVMRIEALEQRVNIDAVVITSLAQSMDALQQKVDASCTPLSGSPVELNGAASSTAPSIGTSNQSGLLHRGSLSPDGTKFAGYDETTKGKIGIAVETLSDKRVRHIVLFTKSQSTGVNTPFEEVMSVTWLGKQTIQYDVLETINGKQSKRTEIVKIGF